ncbi:dUTP diphosphatase [Salininema proteolyticum]|uniref:Deoxyuridine 5'-triphosphate nucleotidohydrolase n=1 Tax=Salininema proteolyticum TaxID=1607685 RepID=A0ABV8U016_9ACTN
MTDLPVRIVMLDPDLPQPSYAHPGDAGADLRSREDFALEPGERRLVPTGVAVEIPEGYVGFITPRSGLAHRLGVTGVNSPGTIDSGYRGEIRVNLINLDRSETVAMERGNRIAQLVIQPVVRARFTAVDSLEESARGEGGHGSSGGHRVLAAPGKPRMND